MSFWANEACLDNWAKQGQRIRQAFAAPTIDNTFVLLFIKQHTAEGHCVTDKYSDSSNKYLFLGDLSHCCTGCEQLDKV